MSKGIALMARRGHHSRTSFACFMSISSAFLSAVIDFLCIMYVNEKYV